jgi:hypothetical protein
MKYNKEAFQSVYLVPGAYYCPGCNASPEDHDLPSKGCPCDTHADGQGSLTPEQMQAYLEDSE